MVPFLSKESTEARMDGEVAAGGTWVEALAVAAFGAAALGVAAIGAAAIGVARLGLAGLGAAALEAAAAIKAGMPANIAIIISDRTHATI